jgi:DNA-binding NtrC family response regulator
MAKLVLIGLEQDATEQIYRALAADSHQIALRPLDVGMHELLDADIVFAGGAQTGSLLKRIRDAWPTLPFIVVTRVPETRDWLDALEAGATDYCSTPIDTRQLHWLMESALPPPRFNPA